ncbi:hypothetical protein [Cellulomonas sp. KRMCY2]|uniref:hypothetical protein n=1 Tax=Cellulomonas sp. KRMCY2 TaxID=1304865 RepID=UPI00045E8001|nr:hypothetical protein [Cellulomonas sp. KRMCY2]
MSCSDGTVGRAARAGLAAATATRLTRVALEMATRSGDLRWTRTNHRGAPISLLEGPSVAVGLVVGALVGGPGRAGAAGAVAAAGAAAFGLVDDLSEDAGRTRKGLRGHLGALVHGELTTGGLKVLGIGATALVAAAIATPVPPAAEGSRTRWLGDVVASGVLIAATANLVNLLDLRPGRALKAGMLVAVPALATSGSPAAAACLGAAAAAIGPDLGERDMLGDGGANALGALVGTAAVLGAPRPVRLGLLAAVVGLTFASERISFTKVIARTPVLREIDAWGRPG